LTLPVWRTSGCCSHFPSGSHRRLAVGENVHCRSWQVSRCGGRYRGSSQLRIEHFGRSQLLPLDQEQYVVAHAVPPPSLDPSVKAKTEPSGACSSVFFTCSSCFPLLCHLFFVGTLWDVGTRWRFVAPTGDLSFLITANIHRLLFSAPIYPNGARTTHHGQAMSAQCNSDRAEELRGECKPKTYPARENPTSNRLSHL